MDINHANSGSHFLDILIFFTVWLAVQTGAWQKPELATCSLCLFLSFSYWIILFGLNPKLIFKIFLIGMKQFQMCLI